MEVSWESHNFLLNSSGKAKLFFNFKGQCWVAFHTYAHPPRNKIPTICPTLNMNIWKLTMTVDFKALTEIPDSYHAQKVQQSLKAIAFNCSITKGTKHKQVPCI